VTDGRRDALVDRAVSVRLLHHGLGNETVADPLGWFVVNPGRPDIHAANHLRAPRATTPAEVDGLLARADERLAACAHRLVVCDPHTPPVVDARLALDGYDEHVEVELVLTGPVALRPSPTDLRIRPVAVDDDGGWAVLARMTRSDHLEQCARRGDPPYAEEVSAGLVADRRAKSPRLRTWLASIDGVDVAHVSSLAGEHDLGMVEDLYTIPEARNRGIGAALVAHAVDRIRADGGDAVLIGARPDDRPVHLYRSLGFEPLYLERSYLRVAGPAPPAGPDARG
jgi:ribosomal protein S18 acetylase RimI-like enzyme